MFIPSRCPRCHSASGWHEKITWRTGIPLGKNSYLGGLQVRGLITLFLKPEGRVYRCDRCGYQGTYDDRPETLGR